MIIGNPHEFAIWLDPVKEWTIQSTVEGLFILCIDGVFLIKKSTLSARAVTLSGESEFWAECLYSIEKGGQTDTHGRSKEELFVTANEPRYGEDGILSTLDGIDLTPMETLDSYWKVFLFADMSTSEDVVVYGNLDDEKYTVHELRLPSGRVRAIIESFIEQTKIFDQKELFGLQP